MCVKHEIQLNEKKSSKKKKLYNTFNLSEKKVNSRRLKIIFHFNQFCYSISKKIQMTNESWLS